MLLAIAQGTTGTSCLIFDDEAELVGRAYREFEQHFPRPGWVEHDAAEIWDVTLAVAREALGDAEVGGGTLAGAGGAVGDAGATGQDLAAIGITNQRETVVVWDPDSGEP